MHQANLYLATNSCQVIYIALGTNDLHSGISPSAVAKSLFALASELQATYNVRYVFLDQIINRDPLKFPGFLALAQQANLSLQQLIKQGNNPSVRLWKHRNLVNPQTKVLKDDGVHLNEVGLARQWTSIRGAILFAGRN
jgi:lysophospholipase L1-like esterase